MADALEKIMHDSVGKDIRIICKDGSLLEGRCEEFSEAYDNDPEEASITLNRPLKDGKPLPWLTEVLKNEIEKISVL
jgi:hypothetical protein